MGMKPVFDGHASLSQCIAQVDLQAHQPRQIGTDDTGPQHARAPDTRKRADALRGEANARVSSNDRNEGVRKVLDLSPRKVTEEMERQVDPFEGIDPNNIMQRLERAKRPAQ